MNLINEYQRTSYFVPVELHEGVDTLSGLFTFNGRPCIGFIEDRSFSYNIMFISEKGIICFRQNIHKEDVMKFFNTYRVFKYKSMPYLKSRSYLPPNYSLQERQSDSPFICYVKENHSFIPCLIAEGVAVSFIDRRILLDLSQVYSSPELLKIWPAFESAVKHLRGVYNQTS